MVFGPEEGLLVMNEMETLGFGLDNKARKNEIYLKRAATAHQTIKIDEIDIVGYLIGVTGRERGEDDDMPIWMELGESGDVIDEDFFGATDGELRREENVVWVLANLRNKLTV